MNLDPHACAARAIPPAPNFFHKVFITSNSVLVILKKTSILNKLDISSGGPKGILLTGLLLGHSQLPFYAVQDFLPRMVSPTVGWVLLHHCGAIKTMSHRHDPPSVEGLSSQVREVDNQDEAPVTLSVVGRPDGVGCISRRVSLSRPHLWAAAQVSTHDHLHEPLWTPELSDSYKCDTRNSEMLNKCLEVKQPREICDHQ